MATYTRSTKKKQRLHPRIERGHLKWKEEKTNNKRKEICDLRQQTTNDSFDQATLLKKHLNYAAYIPWSDLFTFILLAGRVQMKGQARVRLAPTTKERAVLVSFTLFTKKKHTERRDELELTPCESHATKKQKERV